MSRDLAVIMSVYHKDRVVFVKEAVQSILDQTYRDFDFFISFDGPLDAKVEEYLLSVRDERVKLKRIEKNGGLARALNYLLEFVMADPQYKFIARMDADDISAPERFETQMDFLKANPIITVVGCWFEEINEEGRPLSLRRLPTDHESLRKLYATRTPFAHPTVIFTKELIEKAGNYPENTFLMEDNILWGKALRNGCKFSNINGYYFKHRINKSFYKRRSGLKYGWNYIISKWAINKDLHMPYKVNVYSLIIGILKMLPGILSIGIYKSQRILDL